MSRGEGEEEVVGGEMNGGSGGLRAFAHDRSRLRRGGVAGTGVGSTENARNTGDGCSITTLSVGVVLGVTGVGVDWWNRTVRDVGGLDDGCWSGHAPVTSSRVG